ncbi:MAG: ABC transporter substrate-binding protein [Acidimicrobiales bacterium]|nr:ABC transporter substrate-binding protein [Acidimicrobiales bacterium]MCB9392049.1 ABC transporter substrate-binding protein [Acidimicrobiaceae bacterium]
MRVRRHTRAGRAAATLAATGCAVLAACGSGESILQAGNDPRPTAAPITTSPGQTTVPGETVPSTAPPTTEPRPIDSLPSCDLAALDAAVASGPVEILFWHGMSNELGRELERIVEQFNGSQDRVRVRLEFQGGYEQTIDKYLQSNTGNRPDLVQMPEYTVQLMVDTESNVPVQACMEDAGDTADELLPAALSAYATESVQWAMPFNVSNPVLYYNELVFRNAGLDPDAPPRTLAELADAGRTIQASGAASYGIALDSAPDGGGGWFLEQWLAKEGEFYSDNANGRTAPSTRVLFDGPSGVELFRQLQDLVLTGGGVYVGENPSGTDAFLKLADSSAPASMTIATSAALQSVLLFVEGGIIPGIGVDDLGVAPMPSPSGEPGTLIGGASLWITAGRGDERAAAAYEFVRYLVSPEIQSQWAANTGYVPVNSGAIDVDPLKSLYEADPRFRVAYDQVATTPAVATSNGPVLGPLREVRVAAAGATARVLQGADPAEALADAAALANALIADYNARR